MIEIVEAITLKQMKIFATYPNKLYRKCKYYVPPFVDDEIVIKDPVKNLNLGNSKVRCFLAYKNKKVVGRIAGIINVDSNIKFNEKAMRISRVDFIDDYEVFSKLIYTLRDWAIEEGLDTLSGPWGFNDTDREGMLTEGFDQLSNYATAYSYPYYIRFFERMGFKKESEWVEFAFDLNNVNPRFQEHAKTLQATGKYRELMDTISIKTFVKDYAKSMFECYNKAYAHLDNFVAIDDNMQKALISAFQAIVDKDFFSIIVDENDKVIAFGVGIAHIGKALRMGKGFLLRSIIPILFALKFPSTVELMLIGVDPEYRNTGVHALVVDHFLKGFKKRHIKNVWMDPVLTTNLKMLNTWTGMGKSIRQRRQTFRITTDELK